MSNDEYRGALLRKADRSESAAKAGERQSSSSFANAERDSHSAEAEQAETVDPQVKKCMFKRQESVADNQANRSVRRVATLDEGWQWRQRSEFLYRWADIFNREFFQGQLPQPVISFQFTRRNTLGHFVPTRNEFGLNFNINLNQRHLNRSEADLLETLVHEQIHLYQTITGTAGRGNYHNKAFVEKAARLGLKVRLGRGCRDGSPGDPFVALLRKHRVSFHPGPDAVAQAAQAVRARNSQRLRRWACHCKAVWCGGTLEALCLRCQGQFVIHHPAQK